MRELSIWVLVIIVWAILITFGGSRSHTAEDEMGKGFLTFISGAVLICAIAIRVLVMFVKAWL